MLAWMIRTVPTIDDLFDCQVNVKPANQVAPSQISQGTVLLRPGTPDTTAPTTHSAGSSTAAQDILTSLGGGLADSPGVSPAPQGQVTNCNKPLQAGSQTRPVWRALDRAAYPSHTTLIFPGPHEGKLGSGNKQSLPACMLLLNARPCCVSSYLTISCIPSSLKSNPHWLFCCRLLTG